jgi:hypothetical protein
MPPVRRINADDALLAALPQYLLASTDGPVTRLRRCERMQEIIQL